MPSNKIQADYEQLAQVANLFVQEAQSIDSWVSRAVQAQQNLESGGWSGEAASKFYNDWYQLTPKLAKLIQALETASEQMKTISQIFSDGENRAAGALKRTL